MSGMVNRFAFSFDRVKVGKRNDKKAHAAYNLIGKTEIVNLLNNQRPVRTRIRDTSSLHRLPTSSTHTYV